MKKIGCFRKDGHEFNGTISLLQTDIRARILPLQHKASPRAPDFIIFKNGRDTFTGELGSAWQKTSLEHNIIFLDVILDSPALQHAMSAVLCEGSDGLWYLYWDRMVAGEQMLQTLYVQEELKPGLGIRPISRLTTHMLSFFPELAHGS